MSFAKSRTVGAGIQAQVPRIPELMLGSPLPQPPISITEAACPSGDDKMVEEKRQKDRCTHTHTI